MVTGFACWCWIIACPPCRLIEQFRNSAAAAVFNCPQWGGGHIWAIDINVHTVLRLETCPLPKILHYSSIPLKLVQSSTLSFETCLRCCNQAHCPLLCPLKLVQGAAIKHKVLETCPRYFIKHFVLWNFYKMLLSSTLHPLELVQDLQWSTLFFETCPICGNWTVFF